MVAKKIKPIRKSYTTSPQMAEEVIDVANQMGVPESSVVNFALRAWLLNYRREQREINNTQLISVA